MKGSESTARRGGARRWVRWSAAMLPVVIAVGALVWLSVARGTREVSWPAALEAAEQRTTIHGMARFYLEDGSEWAYTLWVRVEEAGPGTDEGLLGLLKVGGRRAEEMRGPDPELVALCKAVNYYGHEGILRRLAAARGSAPAKRVALDEGSALVVELTGQEAFGRQGTPPHLWHLYLDPDTLLVRKLEVFADDAGVRLRRAVCEYEYDAPLPPGFDEGPHSHE